MRIIVACFALMLCAGGYAMAQENPTPPTPPTYHAKRHHTPPPLVPGKKTDKYDSEDHGLSGAPCKTVVVKKHRFGFGHRTERKTVCKD